MVALMFAAMLWLAGCSLGKSHRPLEWDAPEVRQHAADWVCRLAEDCSDIRLQLIDSAGVQATLFLGIELSLSRGLYQSLEVEAELVFVLAHELAHRALRHLPPRDLRKRLPLELAADRWAVDRLCALGIDPAAGQRLISRLLQAESQLRDAHTAAGSDSDHQRSAIVLNELEARSQVGFRCAGSIAAVDSAHRTLLDEQAFARLLALAHGSAAQDP